VVAETTRLKQTINQLEDGVNIFIIDDKTGQEFSIEKIAKTPVHGDNDSNWYYRIVVNTVDGCCIKRKAGGI